MLKQFTFLLIRFFLKAFLIYLYGMPALTTSFYGAAFVVGSLFKLLHVNESGSGGAIAIGLTLVLTSIPMIPLFYVIRYLWGSVNISFGTPFLASKAMADRLTRKAERTDIIVKAIRVGSRKDGVLAMHVKAELGEGSIHITLNDGQTVLSAERQSRSQVLLGDVTSSLGRWRKANIDNDKRYPKFQWRVTTYVPGEWEQHLDDIITRRGISEGDAE
jgi:hypothetical protein